MLLSRAIYATLSVFGKRSLTLWPARYPRKHFLLKSIKRLKFLATMSGTGLLLAYGGTRLSPLRAASETTEGHCTTASAETIRQVDLLYKSNKMKEALVYLERHNDSNDAEILWRLARLCYKVGKYHVSSQAEAEDMAVKAVTYAEKAIEADGVNFACHKWMGIILSWSSEFQGTKKHIEKSFDIKEHFTKAIELNPQDPTCHHVLGQWCYSVASVPWYQRKIAAVIFTTPPYSTYEEALSHFQKAEKLQPGFYSTNWLFIGKCYLQLGKVSEGGEWLKKAASHSSMMEEDLAAKREAEELLKKLGIDPN